MKDDLENIDDNIDENDEKNNEEASTNNLFKIEPIKIFDNTNTKIEPKSTKQEESKETNNSNLIIKIIVIVLIVNSCLVGGYFFYSKLSSKDSEQIPITNNTSTTQEVVKETSKPVVEKPQNEPTYQNDNEYRNKFGRVVNDKYVGGSLIEFLKNSNQEEYYYLRDQFFEILDTMYVTQDKITYYYLTDIINKLADKADYDMPTQMILNVDGKKLYFFVGFPKGYNANTPSWVEFEIFERKFKDGLALRTAHVRCAIDGVEYKDWEAIDAIYR